MNYTATSWGPEIYRMEWWMLGTMLALSLVAPTRSSLLRTINRGLHALAQRRRIAILVVLGTVLLGRLALLPSLGIPKPAIADEFGYLLTADTFAHGRLTNPTMPMWKSFQTFHEFMVPTYQSQYPIGYPAVLAFAQWLFHDPWFGVYLATALMCAATCWMLQAWVPPYWAFLGGMFAALRFGLFGYWMNSFWGGSLAALGGCLLWGALPRILPNLGRWHPDRPRSLAFYATLLGLGVVMLATTRPYEGMVISLPAAAMMLHWLVAQRGPQLRIAWTRVVLPCVLLLGVSGAIVCYYQYKVTGHATQSTYDVAMRQYEVSPPFVFQNNYPVPHYDFIEMRWIYVNWEGTGAARAHNFLGFIHGLEDRVQIYWTFYAAPLMTLPLLAVVFAFRDRKIRLIWITLALLAAGILIESWIQPHYIAPAFCLYVLVLIQGIRHLRQVRVKQVAVGRRMVRVLPVLCLLMIGLRLFAFPDDPENGELHMPPNWAYSTWRLRDRDRIEKHLDALPGRQLVLVRYRMPFHNVHEEIVYNFAEIADAKVLWARSSNREQNCELVHTYADRDIWVVDNWGLVYKLLQEDPARICDPRNPIYEINKPREFYTDPDRLFHLGPKASLQANTAAAGTAQIPASKPESVHVAATHAGDSHQSDKPR